MREPPGRSKRITEAPVAPGTPGYSRVASMERYRRGTVPRMAMNLRLTDAETDALRRKAAQEGRSMQEVARAAIAEYVGDRPGRLRAAIELVRIEDQELLDRLSR